MRNLKLVFVMFLVIGCGKFRHLNKNWPANVTEFQGLSTAQEDSVVDSIHALNTDANRRLITLSVSGLFEGPTECAAIVDECEVDSPDCEIDPPGCEVNPFDPETFEPREDPYPIIIRRVPANPDQPNRAGYAIMKNDLCEIELSEFLFDKDYEETLQSVLWHEIGHCAGLAHVEESNELMSRTTSSFGRYSNSAIERFFDAIQRAAGLS